MKKTLFACMLLSLFACKNNSQESTTIDAANLDGSESEQPVEIDENQTEASYHDDYKDVSIVGHFVYFADAEIFTPCNSNEGFPVTSDQGDVIKNLQTAYLNTIEKSAEPVFIEVLGKYEPRPAMEGDTQMTLVIDQLIELNAYRDCP